MYWEERITSDPAILGGKPVVRGTRVPVRIILGALSGGDSIEDVWHSYRIAREDVLAALEYAAEAVEYAHIYLVPDRWEFAGRVAEAIAQAGYDVVYVPDSEYRGAADLVLWTFGATERRILVTQDLDFPLRETPAPPGLVLIRAPGRIRAEEIADVVRDFLVTFGPARLVGHIVVLRPNRVPRFRPMDAH